MTIQWYPGHMHKAQKEIKKALPNIDLIIEVLDARIPYSSSNPVIAELSQGKEFNKPIIKIMNKVDLADPEMTRAWVDYFEQQDQVRALPLSAHHKEQVKKILGLCVKLAPQRVEKEMPVRAMIMGIPNVGKSTIINSLAGRTIAKVGNQPAVTQRQQRIDLAQGVTLFDTPGILWPKIENLHSSYRLAISGAIKDTALDYDDIAFYAVDYLREYYPQTLSVAYQLESLEGETFEILEAIGRRRGCLRAGGQVDLDKVCKILINELRSAKLGAISLESPVMIEQELVEVAREKQLKEDKNAARKKARKKNKR